MTNIRRTVLKVMALALLTAAAGPVRAQAQFPDKPLTMIVPYAPGGGTDLASRVLASFMEKYLKQPVIVENRGGGGGAIGLTEVYRARPDGYKFGIGTGSNTTIAPHAGQVAYDALKFSYIASYFGWPYMIVVNGKLPVKNLDELIAYGRANPDALINTTAGGFGVQDVGMAMLAEKANIKYRTLPNNSAAESTTRMLAGDANINFGAPSTNLDHVKAGTMKAVAIVSDISVPELDALKIESTKDKLGFALINRTVVLGPPDLPEAVRAKLEAAVKAATQDPEVIAKLNALGLPPFFKPGPESAAETKQIYDSYGVLVKRLLANK